MKKFSKHSKSASDNESDFTETTTEVPDVQEYSGDEECEDYNNSTDNENHQTLEYVGKDGTKWKSEPKKIYKTPPHNLIREPLHKVVLPPRKVIENPVDSFKLFLDEYIMELIVKYTNTEAPRVLGDKWKTLDKIELQAFLSLLITAGVNKQGNVDFTVLESSFWQSNISCNHG
jgi:hypothetical protein